MGKKDSPEISICMVSLNCWRVLGPCMESLSKCTPCVSYEITIVDNASSDDTVPQVKALYPDIRIIENQSNVGFTKATNQGITASTGRYMLWLNTDTILRPDSLYEMWSFLELHPDAGIVGPKVLNKDGSFQPQCRRGAPTLIGALAYFTKLYRLFPKNRALGQYLLSYLPVNKECEVVAVSGCCLLAKREVFASIGPLDEEIFGFGEDVDWCYRARNAGWKVWYLPKCEIIHFKGQGGVHSAPLAKVWGIHQAMWVFYRKHLRTEHGSVVTGIVWLGIWAKFLAAAAVCFFQRCLKE